MMTVYVLMVLIGQAIGTPAVVTTEAECNTMGQEFLAATKGKMGENKTGYRCSAAQMMVGAPAKPPS